MVSHSEEHGSTGLNGDTTGMVSILWTKWSRKEAGRSDGMYENFVRMDSRRIYGKSGVWIGKTHRTTHP